MMRLAILVLLLLPAAALGQPKEDEKDKVSNDRPDRPLQLPPASSEVREAFDDYERFRKRGAWERALKSLYTIPEEQSSRFVDGRNGFIISVVRKRHEVLSELPPEGQAAYRLFHDDDARKQFEKADGPSELKTLDRIFSSYFPTSVGDNAANRLGDLSFEMGRFDRAADCWLAILREHADSDLSSALISVKAALALSRAGRHSALAALRREIAERYAGESVTIGGKKATAIEHLEELLGDESASTSRAASPGRAVELPGNEELGPDLSRPIRATWQMRFAESIVAGMTPAERTQWESNPLSGAVPSVAVDGQVLYANFLGYLFALNLGTGKLIWRSGAFHDVDVLAAQDQARMLDPARFAIVAARDFVWVLSRDLKDPNQMAPFRLTCRRSDRGDVVWQTTDLPDYSHLDLVGTPLLANGTLFVAAKSPMQMQQQGQGHQYLLAVRPHDGKLLWKADVATSRQGQRFFYYGMRDTSPQPRLLYQAGSVYVDTHEGVLARIDAETGELNWGFGYQTEPAEASHRFFSWRMMGTTDSGASSDLFWSGEALLVKGAKSERIYALDPDQMKLLWDRPIARSARLIGANERAVFLGGPELTALDVRTKSMLWATRLPGGSAQGRVLVRPDGLWQLTPRGVFEIDSATGRVRRIFRGEDVGSDGGDLYMTGHALLAVSNRTIAAYPIERAAAASASTSAGAGPRTTAMETRASDE
jgi:outer membrane protein assembly factor BamB